MTKKEICHHCYKQHFSNFGEDFTNEYFKKEWENKILFCMTREGMFGVRQGHYEEDMANIEKAFASLPASDCPYVLEHTING